MYNKIVRTRDKVIVTRLFDNKYKDDNSLTAELKQTVHSSVTYPAKKSVADKVLDNPFKSEREGDKTFTRSKTYVAFLNVDKEYKSIEDVQKKLDNYPEATIFKILSNYPILNDNQKTRLSLIEDKMIQQQEYDLIANQQLIQRKGRIILDSFGKPQYIATFFSTSAQKDLDLRTAEKDNLFYSNHFVETLIELLNLGINKVIL